MQIILLEKLPNLGELGDVVKVRQGYARNYLIPHGKAKRATAENLAEFEKRRAELEKAQAEALAAARERATGPSFHGLRGITLARRVVPTSSTYHPAGSMSLKRGTGASL